MASDYEAADDDERRQREWRAEIEERPRRETELRWKRYDSPTRRRLAEEYRGTDGTMSTAPWHASAGESENDHE